MPSRSNKTRSSMASRVVSPFPARTITVGARISPWQKLRAANLRAPEPPPALVHPPCRGTPAPADDVELEPPAGRKAFVEFQDPVLGGEEPAGGHAGRSGAGGAGFLRLQTNRPSRVDSLLRAGAHALLCLSQQRGRPRRVVAPGARPEPRKVDSDMSKNITVTVPANPDLDDCLAGAAEAYIDEHPELEGWDLEPRWADEARETVALTVPA